MWKSTGFFCRYAIQSLYVFVFGMNMSNKFFNEIRMNSCKCGLYEVFREEGLNVGVFGHMSITSFNECIVVFA